MDVLLFLMGLMLTFVAPAYAMHRGLVRWLPGSLFSPSLVRAVAVGAGPIAVAWIYTWLLRWLPGQHPVVYVAAVTTALALVAWFGHSTHPSESKPTAAAISDRLLAALPAVGVVVLLGLTTAQAFLFPVTESDPLYYQQVARIIYEAGSLRDYPMIHTLEPSGFYSVSSHPLGFISLVAWTYSFTSASDPAALMRLISPFYAWATVWLLVSTLKPSGRVIGWLAAFLLMSTPLYYLSSMTAHIDVFRIFFFCAAIVVASMAAPMEDKRALALASGLTGMALFCHALGVLVVPLVLALDLLLLRRPMLKTVQRSLFILVVAGVVGGDQYVRNMVQFGVPVFDDHAVLDIPELKYDLYKEHGRGIFTAKDKWLNGVAKGFSKQDVFGFSYLFALAGLLVIALRRPKQPVIRGAALAVLLFYAGVALTVILGSSTLIKNDRYLLTIQPLLALVGAVFLMYWFEDGTTS